MVPVLGGWHSPLPRLSFLQRPLDLPNDPGRRLPGVGRIPNGAAHDDVVGAVSHRLVRCRYPPLIVLAHPAPVGTDAGDDGEKLVPELPFYRSHLSTGADH